ncbi:MAG: branched-chain amino acid ABC transporter permease [Alphaproteobacteria bacterium]|nr:branched-chain amino acid ABC transporter permease [Alphaproteobacteria bacterium]
MYDFPIIFSSVMNGLMLGGIYALVALGLTLIYGVLHIINFAHGSLLMIAMFAVWLLLETLGIDPYVALPLMVAGMFGLGYVLYKGVVGPMSHGEDANILLVTLGVAVILDNLALYLFTGDTRIIERPYSFEMVEIGPALITLPKLISFLGSLAVCLVLWLLIDRTDLGKAIRAVAKERQGARLVGIDVENIFALTYAIGVACLGAAACLLLPTFYVSPQVGNVFVIIAFTIVVLGGMGSFLGALVGGLIIGVTEALGGLFLGEALGQIGISLIFILILLFRPTGLFGGAK